MSKSKRQPDELPLFKTPYNAYLFPPLMEPGGGLSLTVPDQTMTIPQLLERQRKGLPLAAGRQPIFTGEDDILEGVDPRTLDLSERHDLVQQFRDEHKNLTQKNKKAIAEKELAVLEAKTKGVEKN